MHADVRRGATADAESRSLLCNVVDVPELCSFILPALHREDPITIAVSTGGASPVLAQRLRDEIAEVVRPEHAALAVRLRDLRPWAKANLSTYAARRDYFAGIVREELG
jgi:siroheme synthase-like protein